MRNIKKPLIGTQDYILELLRKPKIIEQILRDASLKKYLVNLYEICQVNKNILPNEWNIWC